MMERFPHTLEALKFQGVSRGLFYCSTMEPMGSLWT
jgi:hypothetical protein